MARLRELINGRRFADAAALATALRSRVPENRDVLYLGALALRHLGRIPEALDTLAALVSAHPGLARAYQERGHCFVVRKDAPRAIEAFERAVQINGTLVASWTLLEGLHRLAGDPARAAAAAEQVARLKAMPAAVVTATGLYCDGELGPAERIVREFLLEHPEHVEAMRLLARIGVAHDVLDDAEFLLAAVLERAPDYFAAHLDYANVLLVRHKHEAAVVELSKLLEKDPGNRDCRTLLATAVVGLGRHEEAIERFTALLTDAVPGSANEAELHLSIAHSQKTLGLREASIVSYRRAAAIRPNFGDAYWSLGNLKTYRFTDEELTALVAAEASPATDTVDRYNLCFALGKAYEDRRDYARSWTFYERGNALKRAESRYRPDVIERNTANQQRVCTAEFFAARRDFGLPARDPIFIVGLPRSGSTLLEQILASHSAVEGTQELADVPRIVLDLQGRDPDLDNPRYPGVLVEQSATDIARLARRYLDDTRIYRGERPYFIDKMPNNFRHLGLVHLMFPRAKIIDARREPMACCFGNLKQLFSRGQEFAYSVEDIARYYRTYLELMAHWERVLPGRVLRVQHEDVVDDLEGSVRRILDYCELDFEPACVEFHKTARSVRTASSEQVRQPIYREGLDQWRHYEPWLGPLREALGDALTRYRD